DLGRPGYAHLGVPHSGALDLAAHRLANHLVGNGPEAATLETTLTGLTLRALAPLVVAVCGAVAPIRRDGHPAPWAEPISLYAGETLDVGAAQSGVRSYVALAGGVAVAPVLGSRSTDLLSRLGPRPVHDGDVLPLGASAGPPNPADTYPVTVTAPDAATPSGRDDGDRGATRPDPLHHASVFELPVLPGPRADTFPEYAWHVFTAREYTVSQHSNRIALRLDGPRLPRVGSDTIPSEGAVLGAIQVPADGLPIVFLADHPPTGGYPVIAVLDPAGLGAAAQSPPGTRLRFRLAGH
ncbi:MAG: biotin-dependent carboxyltransferase family protein, partial [Actinocrinis sp.]